MSITDTISNLLNTVTSAIKGADKTDGKKKANNVNQEKHEDLTAKRKTEESELQETEFDDSEISGWQKLTNRKQSLMGITGAIQELNLLMSELKVAQGKAEPDENEINAIIAKIEEATNKLEQMKAEYEQEFGANIDEDDE